MGTDPSDGKRAFAMIFRIDPTIFEAFPGLHIGVVHAKGVNNSVQCPDLAEKIQKIQKDIRSHLDIGMLAEHPKIQSWRSAYSLFGAKPKKHRSSVENLYRMTFEGKNLRSINRIVDIYNCVSLKHMIPVGGDDLSRVDGDIILRFATGDEPFYPLGSDEAQTARKGEVIYADEKEVLCRRWNWRECEKTKMTEETQDMLLVAEGLPPVTEEEMQHVITDLERLILEYCGGETQVGVLGVARNQWRL
jgi:lysyl-tRNA synthetase class 2